MRLFPQHIRTRPVCLALLAAAYLVALVEPLSAQVQFVENGNPITSDRSNVLLAQSLTKTVIDLNGRWEYSTQEESRWRTVRVPASYIGEHSVEFRRSFTVDPLLARESVFQLVATSVSYYSEIRINGQFIGKHSGDASFSFKIGPGIIRSGNNEIRITVTNIHNAAETIPLKERLWDRPNYGGIIHDIAIVANGAVWVQETAINTSILGEGRSASVKFNTLLNSGTISKLEGDTASAPISFGKSTLSHFVEIIDPATNMTVATSERSQVTIESDRLVPVKTSVSIPAAKLWSPETPNTYIARMVTMFGSTLVDESFVPFGLRSVRIEDGKFVLNGRPYFLKGITYIEDTPVHARSVTPAEIERDILLIKNTGANAIRFVTGSVHPYYYSMCNKYGLLVFQDLYVRDVPSPILAGQALQTSATNTLKEMIARDGNNPSLIGWGLAQGIDQKSPGFKSYLSRVQSLLKEDNGRLTYATFRALEPGSLPEGLDFAGVDMLPVGTDAATDYVHTLAADRGDVPLFLTSLSYPVQVGNFEGHSDPRSIDAQAEFYLKLYTEVTDLEFPGVFIHAFADWAVRIPIMTEDRVHQFTATAGITDSYRLKRLAYDVIKARFNNEKPPVITSGDYRTSQPVIFVIAGIFVIFLFAIVYNLFRRFRENVVRAFLRPHNFYTDVRDQRILSLFQTSMVGMLGAVSSALFLTNLLYYWRTNIFIDRLISAFVTPVWLKQWINYAAWNPLENLLVTSLVFFIILMLYAVLFKLISFFFKRRVLMFDSYSVTMWSVLPIIILAPFGMVTYRILDVPFLEIAAVIALIAFHLWLLSRILKGTAIVLDVRGIWFISAGYILVLGAIVGWILTLDSSNGVIAYVGYIVDMWSTMGTFI